MELCEYEQVTTTNAIKSKKISDQWTPFLRQLLVCSGGWVSMFLYGFCIGGPTVLIPQIRKEANFTSAITDEMASWLSTSYSITNIPFVIIAPIISNLIGRKKTLLIGATALLMGHIVIYCSLNVAHVLIGQVIQGLSSAIHIIVVLMVFIEYTSPKYRGIFLIIKTTTVAWGIWVVNALGTFLHWKVIPMTGIVCTVYIVLTIMVSPESPYWLASQGKFEECATVHRWLKGCDEEIEIELEILINSQTEFRARHINKTNSKRDYVKKFWISVKSQEFYKPTLLALATLCLSYFCGKTLCVVYALDIIQQITNSESTAYTGMLILDGVTVLSMIVGWALSKYLRRRTLLLVSSSIGAMFLFILSLYLYLIKFHVIVENKYVSLVLLSAFSIAESCGPWSLGHAFYCEVLPYRSRGLALCLIFLTVSCINSFFLKTALSMFKSIGLHGFFLLFGILLSIIILVLYKYFPETKDKTLEEISNIICGIHTKNCKITADLLADENKPNNSSHSLLN